MATREGSSGQDGAQRRGAREQDDAEATAPEQPTTAARERAAKIGDDVDALLDEIDEVLEENAEEFVRGYVQKGGQ